MKICITRYAYSVNTTGACTPCAFLHLCHLFACSNNNPTCMSLASRLAHLEGAETALVTSSGMAAVHATLTALLSAGDNLLVQVMCRHSWSDVSASDRFKNLLQMACQGVPLNAVLMNCGNGFNSLLSLCLDVAHEHGSLACLPVAARTCIG
jgi:cystathionine beta-lyase/cystathionine gamma-synthase